MFCKENLHFTSNLVKLCIFLSFHLWEGETVFQKENQHSTSNLAKLFIFQSLHLLEAETVFFVRKFYISRESSLNCVFPSVFIWRDEKNVLSKQSRHSTWNLAKLFIFQSLHLLAAETVLSKEILHFTSNLAKLFIFQSLHLLEAETVFRKENRHST